MPDAREVLLQGGYTNAGRVTRVGDTVRRPWRPTSPATKALLEHLERVGFDGAPRFLGVDDRGREMLSFVPGEAAIEPVPAGRSRDEALVSVAELLRRYHDAVASFDATRHAWPHAGAGALPRRRSSATTTPTSTTSSSPAAAPSRSSTSTWPAPRCAAWDVGVRRPAVGAAARRARRARAAARPRARPAAPVRRRLRHARGGPCAASSTRWSTRTTGATASCGTAVAAGHEPFGRMWHGGRRRPRRSARARWLAANDDAMRRAVGADARLRSEAVRCATGLGLTTRADRATLSCA